MKATITFKAKVKEACYLVDGKPAYRYVNIPQLNRNHCNMQAFRDHPKYGGLANSVVFDAVLNRRIKDQVFGDTEILKLHELPDNVTVDDSGFLAIVTIEI